MLIFLYFFIGHVIGDFLFQTSQIVRWKQASNWGIALHVALVFIATAFMLIPYWESSIIWIAMIANVIIHFFVDKIKIWAEQQKICKSVLKGFWLDQLAHFLTIVFIVYFIPKNIEPTLLLDSWWFEYYEQVNLLLYIAGFLFFSYAMDIIYFINRLHKGEFTPYSRSYYSMIVHVFAFACLFVLLWFFGRFYLGWF